MSSLIKVSAQSRLHGEKDIRFTSSGSTKDPHSNLVDKTYRPLGIVGKGISDFDNLGHYIYGAKISLSVPVRNFFALMEDDIIWPKLLKDYGDSKKIKNLSNGTAYLDLVKFKIIDLEIAKVGGLPYEVERHAIGGYALAILLDRVRDNVGESIRKAIAVEVYDRLKKTDLKVDTAANTLKHLHKYIVKGDSSTGSRVFILEDYYFDVESYMNAYKDFPENMDIEYAKKFIEDGCTSILDSTMSTVLALMLLETPEGYNRIKNTLTKELYILPEGYRVKPNSSKGEHPYTVLYSNVQAISADLGNEMSKGGTLVQVLTKYKELVAKVSNIRKSYVDSKSKQELGVYNQLKDKEGLIRGRQIGGRVDNAGRSVIIVEPTLKLGEVGIPYYMAKRVFSIELMKRLSANENKARNNTAIINPVVTEEEKELLRKIVFTKYIILGRQPTLYLLGMQAFNIVLVEGQAIKMNPLVCSAYNADFDGDQEYLLAALRSAAENDIQKNMKANDNIFLPKEGALHLQPDQELFYGMYKAYSSKIGPNPKTVEVDFTYQSFKEVFGMFSNYELDLEDRVVYTSEAPVIEESVGNTILRHIFNRGLVDNIIPKDFSIGWLKGMLQELAEKDSSAVLTILNKCTKVGFAVTERYSPNINLLSIPNMVDVGEECKNETQKYADLFLKGMITEKMFSTESDTIYRKHQGVIEDVVTTHDNGLAELYRSGAKGSKSNLVLISGMQGRTQSSGGSELPSMISNSVANGFKSMEMIQAAISSRPGVISKVITTHKPGYYYRQLSFVECNISITSEECGTSKYVNIDYERVCDHVDIRELSVEKAYEKLLEYVSEIVVDRFVFLSNGESTLVTEETIESLFKSNFCSIGKDGSLVIKEGIHMRSPLTCDNAVCAKCYGIDISKHRPVKVGRRVGLLSSQSLGEPGTQLTMKVFQKGASKQDSGNLTSAYDSLASLVNLYEAKEDEKHLLNYIIKSDNDYVRTKKIPGTNSHRVTVFSENGDELYTSVALAKDINKDLKRGSKLFLNLSRVDIHELVEIMPFDYCVGYFTDMLYNIYRDNIFVNYKHIEILALSMTRYLCIRSNATGEFKVGRYYTIKEYQASPKGCAIFKPVMKGVKRIRSLSNNVLESMIMEDPARGVSRSMLLGDGDDFEDVFVRAMFGKTKPIERL